MTTSLTSQLQNLRTAAARHLTVEKRHVSLLFDRKDAGKITNETAFRIGVDGLEKMKRIDAVFNTDVVNDLFTEDRINFVRSMLEPSENDALNLKIEKLLFELSPYLQLFPCQEVLEFLIHTYQIYSFNAETLILTFLPFHETKVYSRLLRILDFDWTRSKEWQFMEQFLKKEDKIPFTSIMKAAMSSSHSMITCITDHIKKGVSIVGSDYLEVKHPSLFNLHAKILLGLLNDPEKVDEMMLSKMMPYIENGIKSQMPSFRYSSLMLISQLVLSVKLKEEVLNSLCKLLITKIRVDTAASSISTLMVVFQQQEIESLSKNTLKKLIRCDEEIDIWNIIKELSTRTDITKFLNVLWKELFAVIRNEPTSEDATIAVNVLIATTSDSTLLTSTQSSRFLTIVMTDAVAGHMIENKKLKTNIQAIAIRFAKEFDVIHDELKTGDKKTLKKVIKDYGLENAVQMAAEFIDEEMNGAAEEVSEKEEQKDKKTPKMSAVEKAKNLANNSEFSKREVFSGDPINKAEGWVKKGDWEKVTWALNEMATRGAVYFSRKIADDIENFVLTMIKLAGVDKIKELDGSSVRSALSNVNLNAVFINDLLARTDEVTETAPKKAKGPKKVNMVEKVFGSDESNSDYNNRVVFVLELLNNWKTISFNSNVLSTLFGIIKQVNSRSEIESSSYQQLLAVSVIRKILENPGKTKIGSSDIDMDCVIDTMRATHSHHLLRDCLLLIVAAAKHSPESVVKHVMSVFTFMGNGMLRKDNELTLSIVEKTVESLFSTIISSANSQGKQQNEKLIELSRLFAASAIDIPAHRRARIAQAISRAVGPKRASTVVLVLVASFCARWQRSTDSTAQEAAKRGSDQDAYDDLAIELLGALSPFEQLSSVLEICEYVLRLGGDREPVVAKPAVTNKNSLDAAIFDRSSHTLPRVRHFRYVIVTLISRVFSSKVLIEKLAAYEDDDLFKHALPLGKRLIECSVELDEFANKEANAQDGTDPQAQRYWVAFASRAEVVSEKLRHLLPGGVAARLIADVLKECVNDKKMSYRMCEKVLQLANIKLGHDGYLFVDSGINEKELITLAEALNKFIVAENRNEEKIRLCQNSAFTLKLIAKHLPAQSESTVLADTMQRCVNIVSQYQKLDDNLTGNVLLLAGELIRSHNMGSTIHHAISLLKTCLATVQECITKFSKSQFDSATSPSLGAGRGNRGQRIRQQSLGGLKFGSDTLLICSLTCIQRVFDQFSSFVVESTGDVITRYCRLVSRFGDPTELLSINQPSSSNAFQYASGSQTSGVGSKSGIHHRLSLIRRALLSIELRILPAHIIKCVGELKTDKKSMCTLFNLLTGYIETQQDKPDVLRKSVVQLRDSIVSDIIIPSLEVRSINRSVEQFENVEKLENTIYNFIISIASVLSEIEFRPVINSLVSWAELGLNKNADLSSRLHLVSLLHFANCLYNSFNSLALPYFGRILEIAVSVIKKCNATIIATDDLLLSGKRGSIEALEADFILTMAIDLISNAARHRDFFTSDRCQLVTDAIVDELVNTKVEGHEKRCAEHLVPAIYRIGNADPDNFSELIRKMMIKTNDSRAKIRYRTLIVLENLIDKIGDGIQPHLTILLPFLNELIEDENKQVEAQCQKVINALQHKFGETFWSSSA